MSEHPTPWKRVDGLATTYIIDANDSTVGIWGANADGQCAVDEIVRTVNQHAALVAQRDELLGLLRWAFECAEDEFYPGCPAERTEEYKRITELLANAKEGDA